MPAPAPSRFERRQLLGLGTASTAAPTSATAASAAASSTAAAASVAAAASSASVAAAASASSASLAAAGSASVAAASVSSVAAASAASVSSVAAAAAASSAAAATPTSRTSTTPVGATTITTIITPSTVIVQSSTTITSALQPLTVTSAFSSATPAASAVNNTSSGLSSGARTGIIVGSVLGALAVLALTVVLCMACRRKRRNDLDRADNIRWPEVAASAEDRAALYPESTRPTGRSGLGSEMEEAETGAVLGAGAAGLGAYAARNYSQSSRQPTLPQIAPSVYQDDYTSQASHYNDSASYGPSSNNSHVPLAPGPASIEYHNRNSPSPPRAFNRSASSNGQLLPDASQGNLPTPGESSEEGHSSEEIAPAADIVRSGSPTDLHAFGQGYNDQTRLSIVNRD